LVVEEESVRFRTAALLVALALAAGPARPGAGEEDPAAPPLPSPRIVGPRTGEEREKALRANGGSAATEKAVLAGLDWLARHQEPEGGWDADGFPRRCEEGGTPCDGIGKGQHGEAMPCPFDQAISALATLAFLGHGHLPGAEGDPYGELVEKALRALEGPRDPWALALSTQAFAEAEAVERRGRFREAAHAGARRLLETRQEDGAWAYAGGFRAGSDVPYTALVVQALVAARDAGFAHPDGLPRGVDRFLDSLESDDRGRLAYLVDGRRYGYTPTTSNAHAAAAIRELLEVGLSGARHRRHLALVAAEKPVWQISFRKVNVPGRGEVSVQIGNLSLYQWWYGTIASFREGGGAWSAWWGKLRPALLRHQESTGCARGSWDPAGTYERQTGGRVFATALAVLMLEQPYRQRRR
jgi:hypothetical protein